MPGEQHGYSILHQQRLEVLLDGGIVCMPAACRPARFVDHHDLPFLGAGCQVCLDPVILRGPSRVRSICVHHDHVHGAVVERPVQAARLERLGPVPLPERGCAFVVAADADIGDIGVLFPQAGIGVANHSPVQAVSLSALTQSPTFRLSVWKAGSAAKSESTWPASPL